MSETKLCPIRFSELRTANVERCEQVFHRLNDWSATDWACAMAGECGEACNEIKKLRRIETGSAMPGELVTRESIGRELADMVIYADLLAARLGIDLGDAVVKKFNDVSLKRDSNITLPPF